MFGAFETIGPVSVKAVDRDRFREAMSRYGAAVHVITTNGPEGKTGFTATAVCSVSDDPPTLLVCVNRKSKAAPIVSANGVFCVNTLAAGDQAIADVFAGRTGVTRAERFNVGQWKTLGTGAPVLSSAVVACDCRVIEVKAVASHNVIFGVVESVVFGETSQALVYHARAYKSV
jgi:flavin reductase (DIM6/NTAB) family NADH-FMN oxidoreductase RutF